MELKWSWGCPTQAAQEVVIKVRISVSEKTTGIAFHVPICVRVNHCASILCVQKVKGQRRRDQLVALGKGLLALCSILLLKVLLCYHAKQNLSLFRWLAQISLCIHSLGRLSGLLAVW